MRTEEEQQRQELIKELTEANNSGRYYLYDKLKKLSEMSLDELEGLRMNMINYEADKMYM